MIDIQNYDEENIFSKILRGELPCKKVFENDEVLAFHDINPQAPIHVIVIPKEKFCSLNDFSEKAKDVSITSLIKSISSIAKILSLNNGYRVICNTGNDAGQEVPHIHLHILAGKNLGRIIR